MISFLPVIHFGFFNRHVAGGFVAFAGAEEDGSLLIARNWPRSREVGFLVWQFTA
jgi:hypothetical protein